MQNRKKHALTQKKYEKTAIKNRIEQNKNKHTQKARAREKNLMKKRKVKKC